MKKLKNKNQNISDIIKTPKKSVIPRSEKQKEYVRSLRQSDIIISQQAQLVQVKHFWQWQLD